MKHFVIRDVPKVTMSGELCEISHLNQAENFVNFRK